MDEPDVVTLASQIVARWVGSAPFVDANGHPRPLPRTNQDEPDAGPTFDTLVESVTSDIRPRAVLEICSVMALFSWIPTIAFS